MASTEPILKGKFAIYETADGGYHLTYRPDGVDEDQHVEIPGMYVRLMKSQMGKKGQNMKKFLAGMMG